MGLTHPLISDCTGSEPGYYEDGNFGIRLENVLIVKEASTEYNFADKGYLAFEHITWVRESFFSVCIQLVVLFVVFHSLLSAHCNLFVVAGSFPEEIDR